MADQDAPSVPSPSPEHRRVAAGQFERANEVIATGNYDYGIRLLLDCCKLDPANLNYRLTLRRTPAGWTQSTQVLSAPDRSGEASGSAGEIGTGEVRSAGRAAPPAAGTMSHRAGYSPMPGT